MLNLKRWIIEIAILSLVFAGVGYAAHEQYFPNGVISGGVITANGVLTANPDGTNEVFQVNDGSVDFSDGNAGTPGVMTVDSDGDISFNKDFAATDLDGILGSNTPAAITGTTIAGTGVMTVSPDGTNETFQVNDGTVDFSDGNAGTAGTATVASDGDLTYNKNIYADNAAGPAFLNEAATTTNPTLIPDKAEEDTGIGWASNTIHIVLGGANEYSFSTTVAQFTDNILQRPVLKDYGETVSVIGSDTTPECDLEDGNVFTDTIDTGETTYTFSNPPASGTAGSFTLIMTNGGSQTVNWPGAVDWAGGTAPSLTTSGIDIITFVTIDAGTIWYGFAAALDAKSP